MKHSSDVGIPHEHRTCAVWKRISDRLVMSSDNGTENYDEVNHMKQYCVDDDKEYI